MPLVVRIRRQYAVYWKYTGFTIEGERVYADPIEIRVRWEGMSDLNQSLFAVTGGSREVIYVKKGEVRKGGAVWKGRLADLPVAKTNRNPFAFVDDFDLDEEVEPTWEIASLTNYPWLRNQKNKALVICSLGPRSKVVQGV